MGAFEAQLRRRQAGPRPRQRRYQHTACWIAQRPRAPGCVPPPLHPAYASEKPVCMAHPTPSGCLDLMCSIGTRAVFHRGEKTGLAEEQEMETTPVCPRRSVSVIRLGQIAYLAGGVAVTCGVEYRQRAGAKLAAITAFALPFLGGHREKHRAARLDVLDCSWRPIRYVFEW
jgi:hypothetical protein